ncbi:MAG: hypothetical protein QG661_1089 [Actinomycetota bacterium]|jgi:uncharacterized membrane protein|nr:hypothetical protein [Actinomycetota bacterium]
MATERSRRSARMDMPMDRSRSLRPSVDSERFGAMSESVARHIGSWAFIAWMTIVIILWVILNIVISDGAPDPFPFIFLTLLLSLQASYAAPLILLAQNRQTDRDRIQFQEDRLRTERLLADTDYLAREIAALRLALGEVATRDYVRGELRDLLDDLDGRLEERAKAQRKAEKKAERKAAEAGSAADTAPDD